MNYLHNEFDAGPDETIEVTLDSGANVQLMDTPNFENYRDGRPYRYYGGYVTRSPYTIRPPRSGHWHLVVDLGGYAGRVHASARVIPQEVVGSSA
jgi:hypothetical protein